MKLHLPFLLFHGTNFSVVSSEEVSFPGVTGSWSKTETFELSDDIQFQKQRAYPKSKRTFKTTNYKILSKIWAQLKAQDKLKKYECSVAPTFDCLQWRCQKQLEFENPGKASEKEKLDMFYVCANWVSINQFLESWLFPTIQ